MSLALGERATLIARKTYVLRSPAAELRDESSTRCAAGSTLCSPRHTLQEHCAGFATAQTHAMTSLHEQLQLADAVAEVGASHWVGRNQETNLLQLSRVERWGSGVGRAHVSERD